MPKLFSRLCDATQVIDQDIRIEERLHLDSHSDLNSSWYFREIKSDVARLKKFLMQIVQVP